MSEDLMQGEDLDAQVTSLQGKIKLLLGLLIVSFLMVVGVGGFAVIGQELGAGGARIHGPASSDFLGSPSPKGWC